MNVERRLEDEFDSAVSVERESPATQGYEGTVRYTVYCEDEDKVGERLAALEADIAFEPIR